jgi:hypothetical protein
VFALEFVDIRLCLLTRLCVVLLYIVNIDVVDDVVDDDYDDDLVVECFLCLPPIMRRLRPPLPPIYQSNQLKKQNQ